MASEFSFDVESKVDYNLVEEAIANANREIANRYDFRGSNSTITLDKKENTIMLVSSDDYKVKAIFDVLLNKFSKRNVPIKNFKPQKTENALGGQAKQLVKIQQGIPQEKAKEMTKLIKEKKFYDVVKFSIDSYEPLVIQEALESGFSIVNDITGLENDEVSKLCASYQATAVIMHMQGKPQTMQNNPQYDNILSEVYRFFEQRVLNAQSLGVKEFIFDVGIGFGKTLEHNLSLIKNLEHFLSLGYPLLVGASRKSMIDKISKSQIDKRLSGTLALHLEAMKNGVSYLRVHDVYEHKQALKVQEALRKAF